MLLTQDLKWLLEQSSALQLHHQTDLLLCTINCFLRWARPQNMAVGDLDFYYSLYLYELASNQDTLWDMCKWSTDKLIPTDYPYPMMHFD